MISRLTRLAAAVLAAATLAPWPGAAALGDPLAHADREAAGAEERLASAERYAVIEEEPASAVAQRRYESGERQYQLGDWFHAAVLLTAAVDEPAWAGAAERPTALYRLGDALRREGRCGAARVRLGDYLALGHPDHRGAAVSAALDCAVKERRQADVDGLLAEAERVFGAEPPAEVRYLAAKATYQRTDLPAAERIANAVAAFAKVGPPFQLQAWYFLGVLEIQKGELHASLEWFENCARAEPETARDAQVRDVCLLALGRMHTQMGDTAQAIAWYAAVPSDSPSSPEALHETAWAHVRAKQFDEALKIATFIPELAPDSPLAPEATLLRGHLLLRLGRYAEATDAYNVVINAYAPVRDELDAILGMEEDPLRYFNELIGRHEKGFDATSVLPPVAVRWAASRDEVSTALGLVRGIEGARRDVDEARDLADRLDAVLQRGGGLDAFPGLQRRYAHAEAVENATARAEAAYVAALGAAAEKVLPPPARAELDRARAARKALEPRFGRLPRTPDEVEERLVRMRGRIDEVVQGTFQLALVLDACRVAMTAAQTWLEQHRTEIKADAQGRHEFTDELRKHGDVVDGYEKELAALRLDLGKARDAAGGVDAVIDEGRVRAAYLAAVDAERAAAEPARALVAVPARALFERVDAARERLAALRARARAVEQSVAAEATRAAGKLRAVIAEEKAALAAHDASVDGVQASSKELLGAIAVRSIADVRAQFYRLVLKADVGIVDVAWSRKRQRLDKIQQLAVQKETEVQQLDRDHRAVLREVD